MWFWSCSGRHRYINYIHTGTHTHCVLCLLSQPWSIMFPFNQSCVSGSTDQRFRFCSSTTWDVSNVPQMFDSPHWWSHSHICVCQQQQLMSHSHQKPNRPGDLDRLVENWLSTTTTTTTTSKVKFETLSNSLRGEATVPSYLNYSGYNLNMFVSGTQVKPKPFSFSPTPTHLSLHTRKNSINKCWLNLVNLWERKKKPKKDASEKCDLECSFNFTWTDRPHTHSTCEQRCVIYTNIGLTVVDIKPDWPACTPVWSLVEDGGPEAAATTKQYDQNLMLTRNTWHVFWLCIYTSSRKNNNRLINGLDHCSFTSWFIVYC